MSLLELPFRATTSEACAWLAEQTNSPWTLASLIEHALIPYVWLEYDAAMPELFGEATGGYPAPIYFAADTQRLASGSEDVLITMTKDADKIAIHLPAPGIRRPLNELRFLKRDVERLAAQLHKEAEPVVIAKPEPKESQNGICKEQVLLAFGTLVKIDMQKALDTALGVFGDDGARVKASAKKTKKNAVWNPVTLALGLNDTYRVPMSHLKRAFSTHDFLHEWGDEWRHTLELLGK